MNQKKGYNFVPVLTTPAGACLTLANWEELGINAVSYYLDDLLMKPGLAVLKSLGTLRQYGGWEKTTVLNASSLTADREGLYKLRSRYDGSLIQLNFDELFSLLLSLQPTIFIAPPGFMKQFSLQGKTFAKSFKIFVPSKEDSQVPAEIDYGFYFSLKKDHPLAAKLQELERIKDRPIYLSSELDFLQNLELKDIEELWLESDKPAADAMLGKVYTEQGPFALLDSERANQHQVIDAQCTCPTCSQSFSRAYLHHLLLQTPLLCQRYLIQHNSSYYQK